MIRAAFLSAGFSVALFGAGFLFVDDVRISSRISRNAEPVVQIFSTPDEAGRHHIQPPEWMPFSLMGLGVVTMLYAIALPRS